MSYARCRAVLYVIFKTLFILAGFDCLLGKRQPAGPDFISLCYYLQKSVQSTRMAEWSVILTSVAYYLAGLENPWELLAGYADGRICLVILEEYVISGFVPFYQVVLQQERIPLRLNNYVLDVGDLAYQHPGLIGLVLLYEVR